MDRHVQSEGNFKWSKKICQKSNLKHWNPNATCERFHIVKKSPEWLDVNLISWHKQKRASDSAVLFSFFLFHFFNDAYFGISIFLHISLKCAGEYFFELLHFIIALVIFTTKVRRTSGDFSVEPTAGENSFNLSYVLSDNIYLEKRDTQNERELTLIYLRFSFFLSFLESLNLSAEESETLLRIVWIINVSVSFRAIKMCLIKHNSLSFRL